MGRRILKWDIDPARGDHHIIRAGWPFVRSDGALFVAAQGARLTLWGEVNPLREDSERRFIVYGTGQEVQGRSKNYIGSAVCGPYVWHVYEDVSEANQ